MRNYLCVLFFLIFAVLQENCSTTKNNTSKRAIYVSSLDGDDKNTGLSPAVPLKTISVALERSDSVFLKAGDTFYETLPIKGKYVSRYGEGERPKFCGYKRIITPHWEKAGENIWRISLVENNYSGFIVNGPSKSNDIGCIHDYDTDEIHGKKVRFKNQLTNNWEIWQTERFDNDTPAEEFDSLYLYLTSDPNTMNLEFSVRDGACQMRNSTIDGLSFSGFGFGIAAKSNVTIRNCRLDAIGGRTFLGGEWYECYGNGIEFYVSENISDCLVEKNYITRCYDCAVTIQGANCGNSTPRNILIRKNLITNCGQAWEDWLNNNKDVVYQHCEFAENICLFSGETGFDYPDYRNVKRCHVLGYNTTGPKEMVIRNNIFVGGNYYCSTLYDGAYMTNIWKENTCYIDRSSYLLSDANGKIEQIFPPEQKNKVDDIIAIEAYRERTGDNGTRFYFYSQRKIEKLASKLKKKYIKKYNF